MATGQVFYKRKSDGAIIPINPGPQGDTGPTGPTGPQALVYEGDVDFPPAEMVPQEFLYDPDAEPDPSYTALTQDLADARYPLVTASDPTTGRLAIGGIEMGYVRRDIPGTDIINGWVLTGGRSMYLTRQGYMVTLTGYVSGADATANAIYVVPAGFRPKNGTSNPPGNYINVLETRWGIVRINDSYQVLMIDTDGSGVLPGNNTIMGLSWMTDEAWPIVLPGNPA